jgi:hypothetical protein
LPETWLRHAGQRTRLHLLRWAYALWLGDGAGGVKVSDEGEPRCLSSFVANDE